ncbi:MAG: hypothetical protein E7K53_04985 [Streptococcus parasanguinis]|uniref:hypothetical protein n=1 Tax=Streptococcus parasanguinis TaxID=1318 RepID=UPI0012DA6520|nr:hypothetical protein [Streptococcus parasanguinis]MDU4523343.1 hypothetical protein [Streptococcus parasanguinis]MDU7553018.1 hypothetical protein [Streptococcus parasanguinis]
MKTYIGYLESKWIYFDEENEVFQYNDQKNTSNWIMVAAPLAVFLLKGIASVLNSAFGGLPYTINISIAMIGTLIVFGMLMIAKARKKDPRIDWKTVVLKEKDLKTLRAKVLAILIMKILFAFLGIFFLATYIRETDFLCLMIYLLTFACVMHFHQEIKTRKIIKLLKRQTESSGQ